MAAPAPDFASPEQQPGLTSTGATRASAPYGQACIGCARAKCKCIPVAGSSSGGHARPICERCARLRRECRPSSGVRSRGGGVNSVGGSSRRANANANGTSSTSSSARRAGGYSSSTTASAATRAANLERRLEDLVAILQAQAASTSTPATSPAAASASGQSDVIPDVRQQQQQQGRLSGRNARTRTQQPEPTVVPPPPPSSSGIAPGEPTVVTPASSTAHAATTTCSTTASTPTSSPVAATTTTPEDEETLAFFRQHHIKFFPCVYIPPDMTAAQLQRDRPYLWLNIRAICCRSPIKQAALSRQIRSELGQKVLVDCDRSIDTLLGALCFLGWAVHLCFKPSMSAVMGIATSIVADLRLDKAIHEDDFRTMTCFRSTDFTGIPHATVRTMEERRATLACYVSSSIISSFLTSCTTMGWTPHMEESLKILATNPEWEGDELLVLMVRVRRLADGIAETRTAAAVSECEGYYGAFRPGTKVHVKYFNHCLQGIKDGLPESLRDSHLATSWLMSADIMIAEIPFCGPSCCWNHMPKRQAGGSGGGSGSNTTAAHSVPQPSDVERVEANYTTLRTSQAFFEHFLGFGPAAMVGFSFPVLLSFFRAAQVLYQLRVVVDDPGWDRAAAVDADRLANAIANIADRYARLPELYGFHNETDPENGTEVLSFYAKCAKTFYATLPVWRAHFAQVDASSAAAARASAGAGPDVNLGVGVGIDAGASTGGAGAHVPPGMMTATGPNNHAAVVAASRVNYPVMNNFMLPDLFSMDFSMDDAWYNEMLSSWDPNILGPMQ